MKLIGSQRAARSWAVKAVVFGLPPGGGAGSIPAAGISGVAPRAGSLPRSWLPGRVYGIPCARQRRPRRFPDLLRTVRQGFSDRDPARTRRGGFFPHGFPLLVLQGRPGHVSQQERVGPTRGDRTADPGDRYTGPRGGSGRTKPDPHPGAVQSTRTQSSTMIYDTQPYAQKMRLVRSTQATRRARDSYCVRAYRGPYLEF